MGQGRGWRGGLADPRHVTVLQGVLRTLGIPAGHLDKGFSAIHYHPPLLAHLSFSDTFLAFFTQ